MKIENVFDALDSIEQEVNDLYADGNSVIELSKSFSDSKGMCKVSVTVCGLDDEEDEDDEDDEDDLYDENDEMIIFMRDHGVCTGCSNEDECSSKLSRPKDDTKKDTNESKAPTNEPIGTKKTNDGKTTSKAPENKCQDPSPKKDQKDPAPTKATSVVFSSDCEGCGVCCSYVVDPYMVAKNCRDCRVYKNSKGDDRKNLDHVIKESIDRIVSGK